MTVISNSFKNHSKVRQPLAANIFSGFIKELSAYSKELEEMKNPRAPQKFESYAEMDPPFRRLAKRRGLLDAYVFNDANVDRGNFADVVDALGERLCRVLLNCRAVELMAHFKKNKSGVKGIPIYIAELDSLREAFGFTSERGQITEQDFFEQMMYGEPLDASAMLNSYVEMLKTLEAQTTSMNEKLKENLPPASNPSKRQVLK